MQPQHRASGGGHAVAGSPQRALHKGIQSTDCCHLKKASKLPSCKPCKYQFDHYGLLPEGIVWLRVSWATLQHQAGFQGTIEALVLVHIQETWSLLDVLFSEIPMEVSFLGWIALL